LLLNPGLCASFGHLFTSITFTITFKFIHFTLRQFQNGTKALIINDLPLIDAFQFVNT